MNSSMNVTTVPALKGSVPVISPLVKLEQNGLESTKSGATAELFHESMQKIYGGLKDEGEMESNSKTNKEAGGKDLPVSGDNMALPAQDNRSLLAKDLYPEAPLLNNTQIIKKDEAMQAQRLVAEIESSGIESSDNDELIVTEIPSSTDEKMSNAGELAVLSSSLRQFFNAEKDGDAKNTRSPVTMNAVANNTVSNTDSSSTSNSAVSNITGNIIGNMVGSTETASRNIEDSLAQQTETAVLKANSVGLSGDKLLSLTSAAGQQQLLPDAQTNLLLQASVPQAVTPQAVVLQGNAGSDVFPQISNAPANNAVAGNLSLVVPQTTISEPFGSSLWAQSMGKQVLLMVNQNISSAEIRLNPAHLGPIEVLIDMSDEQVSVSMSSRHAIVRDAMEQALPKLREMLEQNGFSLADTDISRHSFAKQREQNEKNSSQRIVTDNIVLPATSDVAEQSTRQINIVMSAVDYYI